MSDIAIRHFGAARVKALGKRGIRFLGLTTIPDETSAMPFASGQQAYRVDDNGTGRIMTYAEVAAL